MTARVRHRKTTATVAYESHDLVSGIDHDGQLDKCEMTAVSTSQPHTNQIGEWGKRTTNR